MLSAIFEPTQVSTAQALCDGHQIKLSNRAVELLTADASPREYFDQLVENACFADARRVLAHALPKRRTLWWGAMCVSEGYRSRPPAAAVAALEAVVRLIRLPNEANRRATQPAARRAGHHTMAGCLALAAFYSGVSIAPPEAPPLPPEPFLTGRLVGVAVYLASVAWDPAHYLDHLRGFLVLGLDIARGDQLWLPGPATETAPDDWADDRRLRASPLVLSALSPSTQSGADVLTPEGTRP